jgi:hypothetical protein
MCPSVKFSSKRRKSVSDDICELIAFDEGVEMVLFCFAVHVNAEKLQQMRAQMITSVLIFFKIFFFLPLSFKMGTPPFDNSCGINITWMYLNHFIGI